MRTESPSRPLLSLLQQGLKHRVLCASIPAACAVGAALVARKVGDPMAAAWAVQFCFWALLGFSSPLILSGGFDRPFMPSQDLACFKVRTQRLVLAHGALPLLLVLLTRFLAN